MSDGFEDQTLREQAEHILVYINQDPNQTLIPNGRVRLLSETLAHEAAPEISEAQIIEWFYQNWPWEQNENLSRAIIKTVRAALHAAFREEGQDDG